MRIIKKFGQYINEGHRSAKDMNPDIFPEEGDEEDILPPGKDINGDDFEADPDVERDLEINSQDDEEFDEFDDETADLPGSSDINEPEEEEEPETEYKGGQMMKELSQKLGVKIENNEINYGGHVITCPSEDDIFRIGKRKFRNVADIINYLKGASGKEVSGPVTESRTTTCNCCSNCKGKGRCNCRNCRCKRK